MLPLFVYLRVTEGAVEWRSPSGWQTLLEGQQIPCYQENSVSVEHGSAFYKSPTGRSVYRIQLNEDGQYKLGPRYGYRIRRPEDEVDPVFSVARKIGVPVTRIGRPCNGYAVVKPWSLIATDGIVDQSTGEAFGFSYLVEAFEKVLSSGERARFVERIERTNELEPACLEAALYGLRLGHKPELAH